ncbi:hypothetical protein GCM10025865_24590 [Paraoerskovia sediminicola]|uniref:PH domain-containing protein n=1 Tax=Paraoerskovia sediminicola TaxID=1138587 RepID=A0ABN6XEF3_9CELL|nr:hypothetical protein [Paraoerskovia sediminicola]BDZ43160.1 hypothetical protein GCM10025865_24590 [Paraoerskovia sediminicola]
MAEPGPDRSVPDAPSSISGDRPTWKVRRVARQRKAALGRLVHVETVRPGLRLFAAYAVFVGALMAVGLALGSPDVLSAFVAVLVVLAVLTWLVASEKLLVFERGVVLGSFVAGTRPMALPFHAVDPSTLRSSLGVGGRHGLPKLLAFHNGYDANHAYHHCLWAPYALTFMGPLDIAVRGPGAGPGHAGRHRSPLERPPSPSCGSSAR